MFNLSVDEAECYYANGALVHNCSMGLLQLRDDGLIQLTPEYVRQQVAERMLVRRSNTIRNNYGV